MDLEAPASENKKHLYLIAYKEYCAEESIRSNAVERALKRKYLDVEIGCKND